MTSDQRTLVWLVSVVGILAYGVGIATTIILLYLQFGSAKNP
jgi:hypothetical protein